MVYGVGYTGKGKYKIYDNNGKKTKHRIYWGNILQRCYDVKRLEKFPTYKDCEVCKEWHNFQNFCEWFDNNYYEIDGEKMCLDKDILCKGNKIYGPETCVFVPNKINMIFVKRQNGRGDLPIGVSKNGDKYEARANYYSDGKTRRKYLGVYSTPEEAFNAYKRFKESYIKQVADEYKDKIPQKLYDALYTYEVEITD